MKLIIGLGNPGGRYTTTRHNAGFLIVDEIAEHFSVRCDEKKFEGEYGKGSVFNHSSLLIKPQTFMNLSGECVAKFARFYKTPVEELVVIHDDVDVAAGQVKAKFGGGAGGHNGIRDITKMMGSDKYHRIKVGVGKPGPDDFPKEVDKWVLAPFKDEELLSFQKSVKEEVLVRLKGIFQQF